MVCLLVGVLILVCCWLACCLCCLFRGGGVAGVWGFASLVQFVLVKCCLLCLGVWLVVFVCVRYFDLVCLLAYA